MVDIYTRKLIPAILVLIFSTSCVNTRDAIYFSNAKGKEYQNMVQSLEPVIQPNDLMSIHVSSLNPAATEVFNAFTSNARSNATAESSLSQVAGYLVDPEGYIQFPYLGKIKAAGLSKKDFQEGIRKEIIQRKLLIEPIVDVRFLNYKVSVLGEVSRPSVFTVPNEKITLLEALGLAGDLTIYASRKNVLLIREEKGKKTLARIDLTSDELFTSPYYYLKSNDIIYVEPNKTKIASAGATRQWLPLVLSSLTLVVVSIDRLTR